LYIRTPCSISASTCPTSMPGTSRVVDFFCNDTTTSEIYTLSLHDALPISDLRQAVGRVLLAHLGEDPEAHADQLPDQTHPVAGRSEEHTSELQSRENLVCRLLLEKKKTMLAGTTTTAPRRQLAEL